jgi:lysophospholipase L1-like esterase
MGDSFSSGAGARDPQGNAKWIGPSSCFRSPYGWGQRLSDSMSETHLINYTNVACGGAKLSAIKNVIQRRSDRIPAQIDSISKEVDYILMSIGANDLGVRDLVLGCFLKGLRDVVTCREQINKFRSGFAAFRSDLTEALLFTEQMLNPDDTNLDAQVVIVSYPHTITSPSYFLRDKFSDDAIDISAEIRQLSLDGDVVLRNVIIDVNELVGREYVVLFNHTKDLFDGHEPDPSYEIENPDGWFWEFNVEDFREWYHLNTEGHIQLGEALLLFFQDELLIPVSTKDEVPCTNKVWCPVWDSLFLFFSSLPSSFWT